MYEDSSVVKTYTLQNHHLHTIICKIIREPRKTIIIIISHF